MTRSQYLMIKSLSEERVDDRDKLNTRKLAEAMAYMFFCRDKANKPTASIEDQQTHYWSEQRYRFYLYGKHLLSYKPEAVQIIKQFAG